MIVTSYTSLVVESHRADCAGLVRSVSNRIRRRPSTFAPPETYRERDIPLLHLAGPLTLSAEVADFGHVASGKIRGAA
jgi:hypothetical protein